MPPLSRYLLTIPLRLAPGHPSGMLSDLLGVASITHFIT